MIEKFVNYFQLQQDKLCVYYIDFQEENIKKFNQAKYGEETEICRA